MPVFDESDRGTHAKDYTLLHHGHVHLHRYGCAVEPLRNDLAGLGTSTSRSTSPMIRLSGPRSPRLSHWLSERELRPTMLWPV